MNIGPVPVVFFLLLAGGLSAPAVAGEPPTSRAAPLWHDWVRYPAVDPAERDVPSLRLVCAAPSATEICCALGLRTRVVGRTRYCDYPPEVADVPVIGALDETNPEVLLALKPDLVFVAGTSRAITERLDRLGLRCAHLPDRNLADVFAAIRRVGALTGRPRTASRLCAGIQADLERIARRYRGGPSRRVLILLAPLSDPPSPPFVAGPGSLHDELLRLAGQRNAADFGTRAYGPLGLEALVRADPDVIIELDADGSGRPGGETEARAAWSRLGHLRAVRSGRVRVLSGRHLFIPGPRVARTFAELCRAVSLPEDEHD